MHDWRKEIVVEDKLYEYHDKLLKLMKEFKTIRDYHLGRISIAKHRTKFPPGEQAPCPVPYIQGQKHENLKYQTLKNAGNEVK